MTAIIDYDAGNIQSVVNALNFLGVENKITKDRDEILAAERVILPGVGAFGDAMKSLKSNRLDTVIYDCYDRNKPFLGICIGLQLLFEQSDESKNVSGLGVFKGKIKKIPDGNYKIPHIGWNNIDISKRNEILKDIPKSPYLYFVHSYYLDAFDKDIVTSTTFYGTKIEASVSKGNFHAVQFHPERSGETGLKILKNFMDL